MAAILGLAAIFVLGILVYYVLCVIGRWKLFNKMEEPGWKALIPFYSDYIIYKHCWDVRAWFLLMVLAVFVVFTSGSGGIVGTVSSLASFIMMVIAALQNYKLSLCFGHGVPFALGLYFLNPIFVIILGFGQDRFDPEGSFGSYF